MNQKQAAEKRYANLKYLWLKEKELNAEMLEALEAVDGWFEGDRKNEPKTWLELGAMVKQAIAKAEGGE